MNVPEQTLPVNASVNVVSFHKPPDRQTRQRGTKLVDDGRNPRDKFDPSITEQRHDRHDSAVRLGARDGIDLSFGILLRKSSVHLFLHLYGSHKVTELESAPVLLGKLCCESVVSAR